MPTMPAGRTPVAWVIFALCVLAEMALAGADFGLYGTPGWRNLAYANGGFWIGLLRGWAENYRGQSYLMFASYGFLHSGVSHLLVNMLALLWLSKLVARRINQKTFVALYGFSLLGGAVGFAVLSDNLQPMIGASGAVYGLVGALVCWEIGDRRNTRRRLWPTFLSLAVFAGLNGIHWLFSGGQLAWQAHLGGFVVGFVGGYLAATRPGFRKSPGKSTALCCQPGTNGANSG